MFYLTIIAFLGYNYWSSVQAFKAFEHLDAQLNTDSEMMKQSESFVYHSIEKNCKAYQTVTNSIFLAKSEVALKIGNQAMNFIEQNKRASNLDSVSARDFSSISPNNSFFSTHKIKEFRDELTKFHQGLIHLADHGQDQKNIEESLCLTKIIHDESYWNELKHLPLLGVSAALSALKNQILFDKMTIFNYLNNKTNSVSICGWTVYKVAIAPKKAVLIEGETFEADVYIASYSSNFGRNVTIKVNGKPLEINEGVAHFKGKKEEIGTKIIKAEAIIRNPLTGASTTAEGSFEYQVLPKCSRDCQ